MINVGVIGAGAASLTAHIPALLESSRFELIALHDRDAQRLDDARSRFSIPHADVELESLLAIPGLEAVVVATPPDSHALLVSACLRADKHVLCEKPLARSLEECRTIVELAVERGLILAVGHEKRFHPTLEVVRSLLRTGALGKPFALGVHWASNAKLDPDLLVPEGFRPGYEWRWSGASIGGGLVQDHLPHYVDLVRHWTGQEPTSIYAHCVNAARDVIGWSPESSLWEDLGIAIVRFSSDLVMRFETSVVGRALSPIWSLGSGIGEWTEHGFLLGSEGQLVFDLLPWDSSERGRVALWQLEEATRSARGWTFVEQPEPARRGGGAAETMFRAQVEAWADTIEGRVSAVAMGQDGAVCVAAVEAAYRSAESHAEEEITPWLGSRA